MTIVDLYKLLFGRKGMADGSVIDMSEHGRVGGISTGQPFKFVSSVDSDIPTILNSIRSNQGIPDGSGRMRVNIETGTVTTVTTVTTLSNQTSLGGYLANNMVMSTMNNYAVNALRQNISIT